MKVKIISAIYFDMYGTDLGGRTSRNDHYLYSMNSIMNIDNVDFVIYTNNKTKVDTFFLEKYPNKINKFKSIEYNLYNNIYRDKINKLKNVEETKKSDRCIELQYSKLYWIKENCYNADFIYWIDAGLCYSGLFPNRYLNINSKNYYDQYYGSKIFNNKFLNNLIQYTSDSILVCAKDNVKNYWDGSLPSNFFISNPCSDKHIIGGFFGGNSKKMSVLSDAFNELTENLLDKESKLYSEEQILSCLYYNYNHIFSSKYFDIWWHEDNIVGNVGIERSKELLLSAKSFYKILEELQ
jgi:hypothetical protein